MVVLGVDSDASFAAVQEGAIFIVESSFRNLWNWHVFIQLLPIARNLPVDVAPMVGQ